MKTITLSLFALTLCACGGSKDARPLRFERIEYAGNYVVYRDTQTGKEYFTKSQGGIIEIEPTKRQGEVER